MNKNINETVYHTCYFRSLLLCFNLIKTCSQTSQALSFFISFPVKILTLYLFCFVLLYDPCVRMDWISVTVITTTQSEKEVDVGPCAMYAKQLSSPPVKRKLMVLVQCMRAWVRMYASVTDLCNPHLPFFVSVCITWKIYKARIMWMCVEARCLVPDSIEHCICDGFNCFVLQCFIKM